MPQRIVGVDCNLLLLPCTKSCFPSWVSGVDSRYALLLVCPHPTLCAACAQVRLIVGEKKKLKALGATAHEEQKLPSAPVLHDLDF